MKDVKIVRVEAVGKPAKNSRNPYNPYRLPVRYTLVDGSELYYGESFRLLREAKAAAAAMPKDVDNMEASFDEDGKVLAVATHYEFGGRAGLVARSV